MRNLQLSWSVILFLFLISCGESNTQREENGVEENTVTETAETDEQTDTDDTGVILFFGNSLTAGYGLDQDEGFPARIQDKLDSLNLDYQVVNAGLSGETTAGGRNRIDWVMNQDVDIFVLELGANDGLRGVPVEETRRNLQAIIDKVRETNPDTEIILAGMQIPPNLGREYAENFRQIFPELAEENDIHLIPFLLEGVAGNPELNLGDGIHPTAEGYEIVAENVWEVLGPVVKEDAREEVRS